MDMCEVVRARAQIGCSLLHGLKPPLNVWPPSAQEAYILVPLSRTPHEAEDSVTGTRYQGCSLCRVPCCEMSHTGTDLCLCLPFAPDHKSLVVVYGGSNPLQEGRKHNVHQRQVLAQEEGSPRRLHLPVNRIHGCDELPLVCLMPPAPHKATILGAVWICNCATHPDNSWAWGQCSWSHISA